MQAAAKEKASQGRVVAVGEGRTSSEGGIVPCPFEPGDNVKFMEYAPIEIKVRKPPGTLLVNAKHTGGPYVRLSFFR